MKRNREYRHRLQSQKVKVGDDYDYAYVLQLHINNFAFEGKEDIKYIHYLKDKDGDLECDNEIVVHIYVPNLYKKWYTSGIESLTEEERFLLVMIEPDVEKAKLLAKGDKIMEEYVEESLKVSQDDDLLEAYDKEWAIKDQSFRDGREEGIEQTKNEIAKKMFEKKCDIKSIMEFTGLSKEKIELYVN